MSPEPAQPSQVSALRNWASIKPWQFSWPDSENIVIKIQPAVEPPTVKEVQQDGWVTCSTLYNDNKLVGYQLNVPSTTLSAQTFPDVRTISGFSMAISYSPDEPDDELVLVLGSPHIRLIRLGKPDNAIYQLVMRRR